MRDMAIFTDASLNPKLKMGMGAFIMVPAEALKAPLEQIDKTDIIDNLSIKKFTETSSAKLELQTVLWAVETYQKEKQLPENSRLFIYTDSQLVSGLLKREQKLEETSFHSRNSKRQLKNALLYKKFFGMHKKLDFKVIKVKGHSRSGTQDTIHKIFMYLDREVRRNLREWLHGIEKITD